MKSFITIAALFLTGLYAALFCSVAAAKPSAPTYSVAPTPDWVVVQSYDPDGFKNVKYGNAPYLLYSEQSVFSDNDLKDYSRQTRRVDNVEGAESASQITIDFDPTYQKLIVHSLTVTRDGVTTNRLSKDSFKLYRVETDADRLIYNGTVTASMVLEDIRVGDIIDYAYSTRGRNNYFKGTIGSFRRLQYGVPIDRHYIRLSVPADRAYQTRSYAKASAPKISQSENLKTYEWAFDQQEKLDVDDDAPQWYMDYPYFQISDKTSWVDVGRWKANLYAPPKKISPELKETIAKIRLEHYGEESQIKAVLKFVQSEIRYLGIEIGEGGYVPRDPSKVYARRFGDCKDKTRLMVTMLDRLGIKATPLLVHTDQRQGIDQYLPYLSAFDHVITHVKLSKTSYFLDPTNGAQTGELSWLEQPFYGKGVLISPNSKGLIDINPTNKAKFDQDTVETFGIGSATQTITLYVETKLYGDQADSFLRWNDSQGIEAVQKNYLEHYQKTYPTIEVLKPITYEHNAEKAVIDIIEQYMIPNAWQQDDDEKPNYDMTFEASPTSIADSIPDVNKKPRKAPLAIKHKVNIRHKLAFNLPDDWSVDTDSLGIENDSFKYSKSKTDRGNLYTETYTYTSKQDHIMPDKLQVTMKDIEKIDNDWGVSFTSGGEYYTKDYMSEAEVLGAQMSFIIGLLVLGGIILALVLGNRKTRRY